MGKAPQAHEAVLRVYPVDRAEHLRFIEVEGELREASNERWSALLRGLVDQRAEGVAVDLRGCREIDAYSLEPLLAAAATLRARGGSGVVLVMLPGSQLAQRLRLLTGNELQMCDSAGAAKLALGERRMPVPWLVRVEQEGGMAVIAVNGEFDLERDGAFRAALDEALALETPLVVDLEHCSLIDSTGIGLLLRSFRRAGERGFALVASGPQVHRVMDLVGIPQHLPTYDSRADAVGALAA